MACLLAASAVISCAQQAPHGPGDQAAAGQAEHMSGDEGTPRISGNSPNLSISAQPENVTKDEALRRGRSAEAANNIPESIRWYRKAANMGSADAQASLAWRLYFDKSCGEAARWGQSAADKGNANGERVLGQLYEAGCGVRQNAYQAMKWYEKASDQGNADAAFDVGMLYLHEGTNEGRTAARHWFENAATRNVAAAMGMLAYMNAFFSPQDCESTKDWLNKERDYWRKAQNKVVADSIEQSIQNGYNGLCRW